MSRKQVVTLVIVNALISMLVSLVVALLVTRATRLAPIAAIHTLVVAPSRTAEPSAQGMEPAPAVESPAPTAAPIIYVVQPGDTISSLAFKYDVSEADIIAANDIQNPDFLPAGVELLIPLGGWPEATVMGTPVPAASGVPLPSEPPSAAQTATYSAGEGASGSAASTALPTTGELRVEITEIVDVGTIELERVVIANVGERLADMLGWTLADADGNAYTFPNYRLWAGGRLTLHTCAGQDGNPISSLFWGKPEAIWAVGEVATLKNAEGAVITTYAVGP